VKYLVMTEGDCEKALLDLLLSRGLFKYSYDDLVYQEVFHARQFDNRILEMINQLPKDEKLSVVRVGDKLSDKLKIPKDLKQRIVGITKVCTKPEFEILHIIHERKFDDYLKDKSSLTPSEYYRGLNRGYRKTYGVNQHYFSAFKDGDLIALLKDYDKKRKRTHGKDELSLTDLLKQD